MTNYGVDPGLAPEEIRQDSAKIRRNALLHEIYISVYRRILAEIPAREFPRLLELGSGGGFFKEVAPHVVTSDCVPVDGIDKVVDAGRLTDEFAESSLDAIAAFNVFHHLPDPAAFLRCTTRVLRPGGRAVLIEPWFTSFGQWFYRALHHEPYLSDPNEWRIVGNGRLAGANSRLPTSVFRDSDERFQREFPELTIVKREPIHKWLYLFSGGLRLNPHLPRFLARKLVELDARVSFGNQAMGIFAVIVIERSLRGATVPEGPPVIDR
jgi:SAM-dependent methyltransferase